jgi:SAM-dependent methyltransferase
MANRRVQLSEKNKAAWRNTYSKTPYRDLPWFSPKPYPWVEEAVRERWWRPGTRVLDIGCGAGTNSLFLARSGFEVSGIDVANGAIEAARGRAAQAKLHIDLRVADALILPYPDRYFGGAIDIGCFHTLPVGTRAAYAKEVARVLRPKRSFALSWVAREHRGTFGPPHRPSVEEVTGALEEDFLFRRVEFRPSASGRQVSGGLPVYCALLGRRSFSRPPKT